MADLEKDFDYKDENFDFIQQKIRNFCLQCEHVYNLNVHSPLIVRIHWNLYNPALSRSDIISVHKYTFYYTFQLF